MPHIIMNELRIDEELYDFLVNRAIPGTGIDPDWFFAELSTLIHDFTPRYLAHFDCGREPPSNLAERRRARPHARDLPAYQSFLEGIGEHIEEEPWIAAPPQNIDREIAYAVVPTFVVPISDARCALNAANARWGSLHDALHGGAVIPEADGVCADGYDPTHMTRVIAWVREFLDTSAPLSKGSWSSISSIQVADGKLVVSIAGAQTALADQGQFAGYVGMPESPRSVILRKNGLHFEIILDASTRTGREDRAGISDVVLESAVTTMMGRDDAAAASDIRDKIACYASWLGLMKGNLADEITEDGRSFTRRLNSDRQYTQPDGSLAMLKARSLMLVHDVGHHVTTAAILDRNGDQVPESLVDAMMTALIAIHDIGCAHRPNGRRMNSRTGSIYIVKPKMHEPEDVALACEIFARVEHTLGLPHGTIKMGMIDEEGRAAVSRPRDRAQSVHADYDHAAFRYFHRGEMVWCLRGALT